MAGSFAGASGDYLGMMAWRWFRRDASKRLQVMLRVARHRQFVVI
jgi:hypothetical protein